jgi:1,4-dihydroxy-2-naphthoate polyprenyltransferase
VRLRPWLAILRLQFYPMTPVVVAWGALSAAARAGAARIDTAALALGAAAMLLLEAATVIVNEMVDLPGDRLNRNGGLFTGGSRVLVRGELTGRQAGRAAAAALAGYGACAALALARLRPAALAPALLLLALGPVAALGYTAPPLRLCYRGLGELDVAVVTGPYLFVVGYALQGAGWPPPVALLPLVPVALAVFGAITLASIPDAAADRAVAKRTLAVLLGARGAALVAAVAAAAAAAAGLLLPLPTPRLVSALAAVHGVAAAAVAARTAVRGREERVDAPLMLALGLAAWYAVAPLVGLIVSAPGTGR